MDIQLYSIKDISIKEQSIIRQFLTFSSPQKQEVLARVLKASITPSVRDVAVNPPEMPSPDDAKSTKSVDL